MKHWADYLIFAIFICISLGIGLYHALTGGKQRTTEEFIMANRKLKVIPTGLSLVVSYMSAIIIVGNTAEVYTYGIEALGMWSWGFLLAVIMSERLFVPWMFPLKLISVNEYFQLRYGDREIRAFASIVGIIGAILYMGVCMFAPSLALETATGFPVEASIPIMSVVCVIYTAMGGMRAVIWTDVFQSAIMLIGMLSVLIAGMLNVGLTEAFDSMERSNRTDWIHFSADPRIRQTIWAFTFGWTLQWGCQYDLQQAAVQRYSALPTLNKAKLATLLVFPGVLICIILTNLIGIIVFAYYDKTNCDPLISGQIHHPNGLLPMFVRDFFGSKHGFGGLFLSTLFSGALSSVSSSLSGTAANLWDDIIKWRFPNISEYKAALINKLIVVIFGVMATGMSFLSIIMASHVTQVAIGFMGACGGPILGMFFLSGTKPLKWVRSRGVLIGGISGVIFSLWLSLSAGFLENKSQTKPPISVAGCYPPLNITLPNNTSPREFEGLENLYSVSYVWYTPIGALICVIVGSALSLVMNVVSPRSDGKVDLPDKLFIPYGKVLKFTCREEYDPVSVGTPGDLTGTEMIDFNRKTNEHVLKETLPETRLSESIEHAVMK